MSEVRLHGGPAHGRTYDVPSNVEVICVPGLVPWVGLVQYEYIVERVRGKPIHAAYVGAAA